MQLINVLTLGLASTAAAAALPHIGIARLNSTQFNALNSTAVKPTNVSTLYEVPAHNTNTTHIKRSGAFPAFELKNSTHGVFERDLGAPSGVVVAKRALPTGFVKRTDNATELELVDLSKRSNETEIVVVKRSNSTAGFHA